MKKKNKQTLDQWYTSQEWADAVIEDLLEMLPQLKGKRFVEPAAGTGVFIKSLEKLGEKVEGYDLDPKGEGIIRADFLEDDMDLINTVVIGNPPYGFGNVLSKAFIKRAFEQGADYVGFILPLSIMRTSLNQINRHVEYWKSLPGRIFKDEAGNLLPKPFTHAAWLVLSKEDLQPFNDEYCEVRISEGPHKVKTLLRAGKAYNSDGFEPIEKGGRITHNNKQLCYREKATGKSNYSFTGFTNENIILTEASRMVCSNSSNQVGLTGLTLGFHQEHDNLYKGNLELKKVH